MTSAAERLALVVVLLVVAVTVGRSYVQRNERFCAALTPRPDRRDHGCGPLAADKASIEEWGSLGRTLTDDQLRQVLGLIDHLSRDERDELLGIFVRQGWPTKKAQLNARLSSSELGLLRRRVLRPGDAE